MGLSFDPSMLMDILQKNSSSTTASPDLPPTQNQAPPSPQTPATPPPSAPPPGSPPAPSQQDQRVQGIKGYLSNFLYGMGEGMKAHLGMETDAQKQQRLYTQNLQTQKFQMESQNLQSEIMQRAAQVKQMQSMVTIPTPQGPIQVPFALAKPYLDANAKVQAAATGKRFMVVPNVGMMDTQAEGGPKLVPGSSAAGVAVTPEIAQEYHMPQDMVGKNIPLGQFSQYERAGAMWAPTVSGKQEVKEVSDPNNPGATKLVTVPVSSTSQRQSPTGGAVTNPQGNAPGPGIVSTAPVQGKVPPPTNPNAPKPPVSVNTKGGVKTLVDSSGQPLQGKSGSDSVYATDPKTGQQIYTTRTQATSQGLQTPVKVNAAEVRKDQSLSNRLADVQRKVGDYAATFDKPLDQQDRMAIAYLADNNIGAGLNAHGISVNLLPQYVQSQLKAKGMQALSDAGMKRFILFNQARESLSGYQQILTNSARASDKILELQLEQLPPPIADEQFANMATGEFQKNIDLAGQHIPIFPGSAETQQGIKAQQQAARGQNAAITSNQNAAQQNTKFYNGVPYTKGADGQWHRVKQP